MKRLRTSASPKNAPVEGEKWFLVKTMQPVRIVKVYDDNPRPLKPDFSYPFEVDVELVENIK